MKKKAALVTGGADRIGKSIALRLAGLGYDIILHYSRSEIKARDTQKEIMGLGVGCELLCRDFQDENDWDAVFSELCGRYDLEILVNNASDFMRSDFTTEGNDLLRHHFKVNFESAYSLTKAFAKYQKSGHIINMIDTATEKNSTKHLDYLLSKKLLKEFTNMSALHLAPNIRVNGIAPGLILRPIDKGEEEGAAYLLELSKKIPLQAIGDLEHVQNAVEFLVKNKFITGQIIYLNGGEHL